jgi:hypothetical protein
MKPILQDYLKQKYYNIFQRDFGIVFYEEALCLKGSEPLRSSMIILKILWYLDPLLGNGRKIRNYTTAVPK